MYFVFPDRAHRQNRSQNDPENQSDDKDDHTKALDLERPLPPLPASTHSRKTSSNDEFLPNPLQASYRLHGPQFQTESQSEQAFKIRPSLSNATTLDSLSFEKGRNYRPGLPSKRGGRRGSLVESLATYFSDWWLGEILCWIAGTLCIGAIILVLSLYDGQPVPSRWPLGITLNAFISVISAIGKFSLAVPVNECIGELKWIWYAKRPSSTRSDDQGPRLFDFETFDQASRGPWGAVLLAARLRTRSIASLGATITILTLALDPFFQQIVTYPQRPRPNGRSTVARVVKYDPVHYRYLQNGTKYILSPDALYTAVGGIIVDALGAYIPPAPVFCPSDDCRWPTFQTLGLCSECKYISQYISFACLDEPGDWKANRARTKNATQYSSTRSCGYFLNATSTTPMLMTGYNVQDDGSPGEALAARIVGLHDFDSNQKFWDGSLLFKDTKVPLADFITAGIPDGVSPYSNFTPQALECVFKWCVKTIESTFVNGNLTEKVLTTFQNNTQSDSDFFYYDPTIDSLRHQYHNESITPPGESTEFTVHNDTALEFALAISTIIPASLTTPNSSAQYILKYQVQTGAPTRAIFTNFTALRPLSNVAANIDRLATALTDVMRSNPSTTESVFGTGSFEVFVHVRFGWLALPLIVIVGTLGFLVTTICKASRSKAGIWKTSSLATLMHGLSWDAKMSGDGGSLWRMEDMNNKARHLSVHLDRYKEGGTLDCEYHVDRKLH